MNFDDFVDALQAHGWRSVCDAQHSEIRKLWESWQDKAEPVAWIIRSQYGSRVTENEEVAATFQKVTGGRVEPLYAAPQEPKA